MTNHPLVLNHIKDQTDKLKDLIKNDLYKDDPKKAKLELFMIDQYYKKLKNDNPDEANDILDALTQQYIEKKKEKRWTKFSKVISVIISMIIGLKLLNYFLYGIEYNFEYLRKNVLRDPILQKYLGILLANYIYKVRPDIYEKIIKKPNPII